MRALTAKEYEILVDGTLPPDPPDALMSPDDEALTDALADAGLLAYVDHPDDGDVLTSVTTPLGDRALRIHRAYLAAGGAQ